MSQMMRKRFGLLGPKRSALPIQSILMNKQEDFFICFHHGFVYWSKNLNRKNISYSYERVASPEKLPLCPVSCCTVSFTELCVHGQKMSCFTKLMAYLHAPDTFWIYFVSCAVCRLHKHLAFSALPFVSSSFLPRKFSLWFESLQHVGYSCNSPLCKHTCQWTFIFFGNLWSNSQGCMSANLLCVGVPRAKYQS